MSDSLDMDMFAQAVAERSVDNSANPREADQRKVATLGFEWVVLQSVADTADAVEDIEDIDSLLAG